MIVVVPSLIERRYNLAVYSLWHFPSGRLAASSPACILCLTPINKDRRCKVTRHRALRCSDFPPSLNHFRESDSPPFQNQRKNTRNRGVKQAMGSKVKPGARPENFGAPDGRRLAKPDCFDP